MIALYHGSGAQDFQVLGHTIPEEHWVKLRGVAIRLLRQRGRQRAAELLESIPFELRDGTNGFGDEFSVLYWAAPLDQYVKAAEWSDSPGERAPFQDIAKTVGEIATTTYVRFIAVDINSDEGAAAVDTPSLSISTDVVERVLRDAEQLINSTGATSGVDRIHTALHGYLKAVCDRNGIAYPADASITRFFRVLRDQHPAFAGTGPQDDEIRRIVNGFASTVDALNTIRNQASPAHPTASLLAEPEAMLMINATRTLLHYLNAKL